MKNDQERENKLKEAIRDVLSTACRKDENGVFYEEIYADYRNTLDDCTLKKSAITTIRTRSSGSCSTSGIVTASGNMRTMSSSGFSKTRTWRSLLKIWMRMKFVN